MPLIEFGATGSYSNPYEREASNKDREWFEAHPDRNYYVRPTVPGEFPEALLGQLWYTAVRQVRSGFRLRKGFQWFGEPAPQGLLEGEVVCRAIFDFFEANPERFIPGGELKAYVLSQLMASVPPAGSA